ncbi:MAG: hypothetical protein HQK50_17865 [Oligoflexia bacterium]|nr:hypothetical protein [Oligoflexia bacterium]MBF0367445.1 hypothetical protein [Oligoflexia bacterium]
MNIREALQVLESSAESGSEELKKAFTSEYRNLKKVLTEYAPDISWKKIKEAKEGVVDFTVDKVERLDRSSHEHPWYYIGGVGLVAGIVGFLLGRGSK